MKNKKYTKIINLSSHISLLLFIGSLGFTFASFLVLTFGNHRNFSWHTYWQIMRYLIIAIVVLNIPGWLPINQNKTD